MSKRTVILIPKTGQKVPDPRSGEALPADGKRVVLSTYWSRRIADGSVMVKPDSQKVSFAKRGQ